MPRILICLALLCAISIGSPSARAANGADDRHVVIVTMDGFPAYVFHDRRAPIPTLRKLAAQGVAAEGMRVCNPSVTWPNHTTLATGVTPARHSVLFNGLLVRESPGKPAHVDAARDQADLVAVPTIWDVAHRAGFTTAAINWPCTRHSRTLDDCFPDVANQVDYITPRLKDELLAEGVLEDGQQRHFDFLTPPQHDQIWTRAACDLIRKRKPNLLLLHLLLTDTVQHRYGPETLPAFTAMAMVDYELRDVLAALDDAGIRDKTTIFVTADHGFARFTKLIQPNVLLLKDGCSREQVQIITEGGCAFVYLNDPGTGLADRIYALFSGKEGIADVLRPESFASLGLPLPDQNPRMCNLLLMAKDGYSFAPGAFGPYIFGPTKGAVFGAHGYSSDNAKMNAIFVAAGRGIRKGANLGLIDNIAVAPTAAHLLGQKIPGAQGKVLTQILTQDVAG